MQNSLILLINNTSTKFVHRCVQDGIFNERKLVLGPLDVKVKVKPKKLRNSMILPELLDNLQLCQSKLDIIFHTDIVLYIVYIIAQYLLILSKILKNIVKNIVKKIVICSLGQSMSCDFLQGIQIDKQGPILCNKDQYFPILFSKD